MSVTKNSKTIDNFRFARQELEKERAYRRDKVWKIFSWAASILVAITGGAIALKTNSENCILSCWHRRIMSGAVLFLTGFTCLWIIQNLKILRNAEKAIAEYDKILEIKNIIPKEPPRFGYSPALVILAIAAILAIVI